MHKSPIFLQNDQWDNLKLEAFTNHVENVFKPNFTTSNIQMATFKIICKSLILGKSPGTDKKIGIMISSLPSLTQYNAVATSL